MKVIVVSSYAVIREGIVSIISRQENMSIQFIGETIKEAMFMIKANMADLILLDVHKKNIEELNLIFEIKKSYLRTKVLIFDFYGNKEFFVKSLKCGVQGYIIGKSNEEEILYAIDQIYKGKKYFDSYFIDSIINENNDLAHRIKLLTDREKEILIRISKGLSNREISEIFSITEYTVKKHISHIFDKLNIWDRKEAALYVSKYGIGSK